MRSRDGEALSNIACLDPQGPPLVVVGTDMAALAVIEELRLRGYGGRIQLFGDRPYGALEQAQLAQVRTRTLIEYHEVPVLAIDRSRQAVADMAGRSHRYQTLVLATGARPRVPGIPGVGCAGVHLFHQLEQLPGLMARLDPQQRIAVVGGGLLGVTAAAELAEHGFADVHLLQQEERLMANRLDDVAASLLQEQLREKGVQVQLDAGVVEVIGDHGRVVGLRLRDGSTLDVVHVILATGIKPNTQLARDGQLKVGNGILVDDHLHTSVPNIYAIGACAEHRGVIHGLSSPALEQAAVLAAALMGESVQYLGSMSVNQRDIGGLAVFSHGAVTGLRRSPLTTMLVYEDEPRRIYRKLVVHKGVLIGAMAIGPIAERARIEEAINAERHIRPWRQWRYLLTGNLWPERKQLLYAGPASTVVCRCTGATAGAIKLDPAVAERAGTICGNCRDQLPDKVPAPVP